MDYLFLFIDWALYDPTSVVMAHFFSHILDLVRFVIWAIKPNQNDPRDRAAQDILDGPARNESNPLNYYLYKENEFEFRL